MFDKSNSPPATDAIGTPPFRILSLDGGGAKGFYTLGVLAEIEAMTGRPIWQTFNLIFGTSTGAIIAALLARGESVASVKELYQEHVPTIMKGSNTKKRTLRALSFALLTRFSRTKWPTCLRPESVWSPRIGMTSNQ